MKRYFEARILKPFFAFGARLYLHSNKQWADELRRHIPPDVRGQWLAVSTDAEGIRDLLTGCLPAGEFVFRSVKDVLTAEKSRGDPKFGGTVVAPCLHELEQPVRTQLFRALRDELTNGGRLYVAALALGRVGSENLIFRSAPVKLEPAREDRHDGALQVELRHAGFSHVRTVGSTSLWAARVVIIEARTKR